MPDANRYGHVRYRTSFIKKFSGDVLIIGERSLDSAVMEHGLVSFGRANCHIVLNWLRHIGAVG